MIRLGRYYIIIHSHLYEEQLNTFLEKVSLNEWQRY